jgi:NADP-dependent 3-hydroxy acid dehydrogenase YdfG
MTAEFSEPSNHMNYLKNSIVVITGASSGIGAATAKRLAADGAKVVLAATNEDKLKGVVAEIQAAGGVAVYKVTDVTQPEALTELVSFAEATYGPVDVLVNNAGLMLFSYWKECALGDWNQMIDTNIRGYLHAIAAVLPSMLDRKAGRILNMASVAGHHPGEAGGVYGATKFFIRGMTESLRKEVGVSNNIQVSLVSPGVIDTGWPDKLADGPAKDAAQALSEKAISAEAIANAVSYALNQPPNVSVSEVIVAPTNQAW